MGKDQFHDNNVLGRRTLIFFALFIYLISLSHCGSEESQSSSSEEFDFDFYFDESPVENISELKRGDILVKPNNNWLNGSSLAPGGEYFGHAAIVLNNVRDTNETRLLQNTMIFESVARNIPQVHQNRKINALVDTSDSILSNYNFVQKGSRYRLRPNISKSKIDSIIEYILDQDQGVHSWRAIKDLGPNPDRKRDRWYCSQLIWQAFYDVAEIDLDCNAGFVVYPNDLINHPMFDGHYKGDKCRVRF